MFRALLLLLALGGMGTATALAQGTCGPSALGDPCSPGGIATAAASEPVLNLGVGNPIHLVTGNKYQRETDLPASHAAPGLELVRHYNAQDVRPSVLGRGWALSYDTRLFSAGGRWQIVQADGSRTEFRGPPGKPLANAKGSLAKRQDAWIWTWPDGRQLWFDADGYLTRIRLPAGPWVHIRRSNGQGVLKHTVESVVDASGRRLLFHYRVTDSVARLKHVDTPLGRFQYQYAAGDGAAPMQFVSVTRPDGMQRRYLYEPAVQAGNQHALTGIVVASADGKHTQRLNSWAYDIHGRAILSAAFDSGASMPPLHLEYRRRPAQNIPGLTVVRQGAQETHFETTVKGGRYLLTRVSGLPCSGCAPPGTRARYDEKGRLVQVNDTKILRGPDGVLQQLLPATSGWPGLTLTYQSNGYRQSWQSDLTGLESTAYGPRGLPTLRRLANGARVRHEYDALKRPIRLSDSHAGRQQDTHLTWRGTRLASITHPHETETRDYDKQGRLQSRTVQRIAAIPNASLSYTESFTYDAKHRLIRHALPEGGALAYQWHEDGRLEGILWHDAAGATHQIIQSKPGVAGYQYGNGLLLTTAMNSDGQVASLLLENANGPLWVLGHEYDARNRLHEERHAFPSLKYAERWAYAYDARGRMIGAQQSASADSSHSEAVSTAPANWYAWNEDGSLAALRARDGTHRPNVSRDPSGLPTDADGYALHYGPDRRLRQIRAAGRTVASYLHNAQGQRIAKHRDGSRWDYFYLDNRLVAERHRVNDNSGPLVTRRYIHAEHALVGVIDYSPEVPEGTLYWAHTDFVGAPRMMTDARQTVRWLARYSPTGEAERIRGDLTLNLRLPGQIYDSETGWHDNLLRTYLPRWGHYLEPDPLGPVPGNQALGYARQQPRRFADPLGLLLFAFDGTRHSPDTESNVWKMSLAYRDGPVFYHAGPGNSQYLDWDAVTAWQAMQIVETQWQSLLDVLQRRNVASEHMPIDIIGFSRGAALARHFANLVDQHVQGSFFSYSHPTRGTISACVDLRFMGLFDTVAQFGLGGAANGNYDLTIAPAWQWVAHAVALHERRWAFPLTAAGDAAGHNIVEMPFIGAHADIGGGALRAEDGQAKSRGDLSDVALNWMLWQARAAALRFDVSNTEDREVDQPILHDERSTLVRSVQNGDRSVQAGRGDTVYVYQDDHPGLGRERRTATEALIARHEDWRHRSGSEVGTVDMTGYAQWLHDELGWQAMPA